MAVELRDGSLVCIRPIEPDDKGALGRGFDRLSEQSRYQRFLGTMTRLSDKTLAYLTEVDHHDHEALIALDEAADEPVGVARYVRAGDSRESAEAAVAVVDEWQGRGLGTALLELLSERAREEGVSRFTAYVLGSNRTMLELLRELGPVRVVDSSAGTLELVAELADAGRGNELREALRIAASHSLRVALPGRGAHLEGTPRG